MLFFLQISTVHSAFSSMIHSFKQPLISMLLTALWKVLIEELGFIQSWKPHVESKEMQSLSGWSHQSANAWFNIACVNAGTRADGHSFGHPSGHLLLILSCAESTRSRPLAEFDTHKRACSYRLTKNTQASTSCLVCMHVCAHTHTSCVWSCGRMVVSGINRTAI